MFFTKVQNQINVIVLISWVHRYSAGNINGTSCQAYSYNYSSKNISINSSIKNDQNLNGLDGELNDEELRFKYKNAEEIEAYLKSHYK